MYHGKIERADRVPVRDAVTEQHLRAARCDEFERARRLAAADEELSLIWQRLFDDANP